MRVLTIGNLFPPAATGGYERTWLSALGALRAAGHEARVLTTVPTPGAAADPAQDPPGVHRELRWWWRDHAWPRPAPLQPLAVERHTARVLARHLPWADAVCLFGLGGLPLSIVGRVRRAGLPAVGVVGDPWMVYGPRHDPWVARPWWPGRTDLRGVRWLFNSAWTRDVSGVPGDVVHPGIDPAAFPPAPPCPAWEGRLVVAGRVAAGKGVEHAVAALRDLPGASLDVVGDGPLAAGIRHTASTAGVDERCHVIGPVSPGEMAGVYAAADAVLFPVTWAEPWGLVPLEAMAVGRPVVATGTGGSAEYLRDGENCLLAAPGDPAALAAAVRRLAADAGLRERLVAGGRATAERFPQAAADAAVVRAIEQAVTQAPRSRNFRALIG